MIFRLPFRGALRLNFHKLDESLIIFRSCRQRLDFYRTIMARRVFGRLWFGYLGVLIKTSSSLGWLTAYRIFFGFKIFFDDFLCFLNLPNGI